MKITIDGADLKTFICWFMGNLENYGSVTKADLLEGFGEWGYEPKYVDRKLGWTSDEDMVISKQRLNGLICEVDIILPEPEEL